MVVETTQRLRALALGTGRMGACTRSSDGLVCPVPVLVLDDGLVCPASVLSLVMVSAVRCLLSSSMMDGWVSTLALVAVLVMVSVLVLGADRDSAVTACSR